MSIIYTKSKAEYDEDKLVINTTHISHYSPYVPLKTYAKRVRDFEDVEKVDGEEIRAYYDSNNGIIHLMIKTGDNISITGVPSYEDKESCWRVARKSHAKKFSDKGVQS